MRAKEFIYEGTEIEFVCVNKDVPGSTSPKAQAALYNALRTVPGIIVYKQDFDQDEDSFSGGKSLAVFMKDESARASVLQMAKKYGVEVDLEDEVDEHTLARRLSDWSTTEWYETDDQLELDEMALPANWDPTALGHDKTFKSRVDYAVKNAQRIGGGSSRVAFIIPDQGRSTVLKIAKNNKGLAQNEAEVDILEDGYLGRLPIVIPLVDYDKTGRQPIWIQTEKAEKVREPQLCQLLKCKTLTQFCGYVGYILRKPGSEMWKNVPNVLAKKFSEAEVDQFLEYANEMADLVNSSSIIINDFQFAGNWGVYKGRPVVIDLGFTTAVEPLYDKRRK